MMKNKKGFSLVELLVVIGIIGALASVILPAFNVVRQKGIDARKQMDINQIGNAIALFYDKYNKMPGNYNCYSAGTSTICSNGNQGNRGACDSPVLVVAGGTSSNLFPEAYIKSMQELVDAGFMPTIPQSPGGDGYCYFNFGKGSPGGALIMTNLQASKPTMEGISPSCRPYSSTNVTWCENQVESQQYCMCNPY